MPSAVSPSSCGVVFACEAVCSVLVRLSPGLKVRHLHDCGRFLLTAVAGGIHSTVVAVEKRTGAALDGAVQSHLLLWLAMSGLTVGVHRCGAFHGAAPSGRVQEVRKIAKANECAWWIELEERSWKELLDIGWRLEFSANVLGMLLFEVKVRLHVKVGRAPAGRPSSAVVDGAGDGNTDYPVNLRTRTKTGCSRGQQKGCSS